MIEKKEVQHIANLARLRLSEEEEEAMTQHLGQMITYINKLKELDTTGVPPTVHAVEMPNVWREDTPCSGLSSSEVFQNSPAMQDNFFTVPKVVK